MADANCLGTIHKLSLNPRNSELVLNLPVGVAVIPANADLSLLAAAYRAGVSTRQIPSRTVGKLSIVAGGPLLDSPDEVLIRECRRDRDHILVRIVHTSARLRGAQLRRNIPFRPLLEVPLDFEPGRYVVDVQWQAVESLPNGKHLGEMVTAGPVSINL